MVKFTELPELTLMEARQLAAEIYPVIFLSHDEEWQRSYIIVYRVDSFWRAKARYYLFLTVLNEEGEPEIGYVRQNYDEMIGKL